MTTETTDGECYDTKGCTGECEKCDAPTAQPETTPEPEPERKRIGVAVRQLAVRLTEKETREYGQKLAALHGDLSQHQRHEEDMKADLKAKRTSLEAQIAQLAGVVRAGSEFRPVDVVTEHDYAAGAVLEIRQDTGEVILERPLLAHERQTTLKAVVEPPLTEEQKKERERVAAEAEADRILGNAGDGKLNDKKLKGAAVARKRAG